MDQLPPLGEEITSVIAPTRKIYTPLLRSNADAIKSTPRKTFKYGEHSRQELDVYYSQEEALDSGPIIVFLYGGGYFNGDKVLQGVPDGLVFTNLGHFFAQRGFVTVIPDYRLMSHGAGFPSGGHDLADVIEWIKLNLGRSKQRNLHIIGNSAGGGHIGTFLLYPPFADARSSVIGASAGSIRLNSVVFLATPFQCDGFSPAVYYYGSNYEQKNPLGLLKRFGHPGEDIEQVNVVVCTSEYDPDDLVKQTAKDFTKAWKAKNLGTLRHQYIPAHNHISPPLSLGTNIEREEAWAEELVATLMSFE